MQLSMENVQYIAMLLLYAWLGIVFLYSTKQDRMGRQAYKFAVCYNHS